MPAPQSAPAWRRRLFVIIAVILIPLWSFGVWQEHRVETEGKETLGKVVSSKAGDHKRPRFVVEFPTAKGAFQKEFGFSREEGTHIRGGTEDQIVNPDVLVRYHEEFPDAARLAANVPLPWWGGVIGMSVVLAALWFTMWFPGMPKKAAK